MTIGKRRKLDDDGKFLKISVYEEEPVIPKKLIDLPIIVQSADKVGITAKQSAVKLTPRNQK